MEEEKNPPKTKEDFGKVIDTLHTKSKLSTLRTYQGDVAAFIKDKNKSTLSIALEEKHKKEEVEKKEEKEVVNKKSSGRNFQANLTAIVLSITLIIAGIFASIFVFNYLTTPKDPEVSLKTDIIHYNSEITLANQNGDSLAAEIARLPKQSGISVINISDNQGKQIDTSSLFFEFLNIKGRVISRSLDKEFVFGASGQNGLFLIFKTNDFGSAFSGMLDWEKYLNKDLSFMFENKETEETDQFVWKDMIIKNKDARVLSSNTGNRAYYSFLDKNTLVIANDEQTLTDIFSAFASRAFVR